MPTTQQDRADFELIASDYGRYPHAIERNVKGDYRLRSTSIGWMWWQAARQHQFTTPMRQSVNEFYAKHTDQLCSLTSVLSNEEREALNSGLAPILLGSAHTPAADLTHTV